MKPRSPVPSRRRAAIGNTSFGLLSLVVTFVTGVLFVPLYLAHVGDASYGAWLASGNLLALLSLVDPGISDLSRQRVAALHGAGRWEDVCSTLCCGAIVMGGLAATGASVGILFTDSFVGVLRLADSALASQAGNAFRIACVGSAICLFGNYLSGAIQGFQVSVSLGIVVMSAAIAIPIVRIVLLQAGLALDSFAWAIVIQGLIMSLGCGGILVANVQRDGRGFKWSLHEWTNLFGLSLFTGGMRIANTLSNNLAAILVTRLLGPTATVSFEITRQPMEMARTLLDKPASALLPAFAHLHGANETGKMQAYAARYMRYLIWALGLAVAGFATLNSLFITLWVGSDLYAGTMVNALLLGSVVLASLGNASRLLLFAFGRIRYTSVATLLETIAFVVAATLGIQWLGLPGLAAAPAVGFLVVGIWMKTGTLIREYLSRDQALDLIRCLVPTALAAGSAGVSVAPIPIWFPIFRSWGGLVLLSLAITAIYAVVQICLSSAVRRELSVLMARLARRA